MAIVSLDDDDDVPLLELVDETALLSLAFVLAEEESFCWAAAWNSAPRNCASACATELLEVDDVLDVLDVVSAELADALLAVVSDVLLIEPSPSDASAAAMAAASALVPDESDVPDVPEVSLADSSASFEASFALCVVEV